MSVGDSIRALAADGRQRRADRRSARRTAAHAKDVVPSGHTKRTRQPAYSRHPHLHAPVMPGMDPRRLARVLRAVDHGDYDDFLTAAAELEERDGQYGPQIAVRRTAVAALELDVSAPTGATTRAKKAVQSLIDSKALGDLIGQLLDALGKGFAISEVVWKDNRGTWMPTFIQHDPREFSWRWEDEEWRLRDGTYLGLELEPNKWVVHEPKLRAGIPIRRGLARPAMFLHMCKSMGLAGWVTLMQVFGVPLAIAKPGTVTLTADDKAVLRSALAGLGSGLNAIVPAGVEVEIIKAADAGSAPDKMFSSLIDYIDKQLSKLVLGQTMTADSGSSRSQAEVHDKVRGDIREGDAEQLAQTINEYVVKPFIDFNVGEQKVYPEIFFAQEDSRDLEVIVKALEKLGPMGLEVKADEVRSMFGFTKPAKGDETIGGRSAAPPLDVPGEPPDPPDEDA